jgi:amidase
MTACPVISLPCGFTKSGLPVGIQIMGKPRKENELLSFAYFLEKKLQVKDKVPLDLTKK